MKHIILVSGFFLIGFSSCNNVPTAFANPEGKAQEVCTCIQKNFEDKKLGSMVRECNKIREKHREALEGEALKKFEDALKECSGDMVEEGLNDIFQ